MTRMKKTYLSFSHSDTRRRYNGELVPWLLDLSAAIVDRRRLGVPSSVVVVRRLQIFVFVPYITLRNVVGRSWTISNLRHCAIHYFASIFVNLKGNRRTCRNGKVLTVEVLVSTAWRESFLQISRRKERDNFLGESKILVTKVLTDLLLRW